MHGYSTGGVSFSDSHFPGTSYRYLLGTCLYLPFGPHHTVDVWSNVCVWWLLVVAPEGTRGTTSRAVQVYSSRGYVAAKFGVTEVRTKYST